MSVGNCWRDAVESLSIADGAEMKMSWDSKPRLSTLHFLPKQPSYNRKHFSETHKIFSEPALKIQFRYLQPLDTNQEKQIDFGKQELPAMASNKALSKAVSDNQRDRTASTKAAAPSTGCVQETTDLQQNRPPSP